MNVGVFINDSMLPAVGGGYSYQYKLINRINEYSFSNEIVIKFIISNDYSKIFNFKKEVILLKKNRPIEVKPKKNNLRGLFNRKKELRNKNISINDQQFLLDTLINNQIQVIYRLTQGFFPLLDFPTIFTNWDIGHRSTWPFPEMTYKKSFTIRENTYNTHLAKALSIFCESETGKEELLKYTNINDNKICVVPMFPGSVVDIKLTKLEYKKVENEVNLEPYKFYLYPAQFWPHKNHYNLIKAFAKIVNIHQDFKLVLTGGDQGNLNYIKKLIEELNLKDKIILLGFVKDQTLFWLYKNAICLVMPTFLGPTNMPLLEARELNCPVLCSDLKGHREMLGDGAIYFDPQNNDDIAKCMIKITDKNIREEVLKMANFNRKNSIFNIDSAIKVLEKNLMKIANIRNCWDNSNHY